MPSMPEIDFDGADVTRAEMLEDLRDQVDPDIAAALSQPGTPDYLLARPFQVPQSWDDLRGHENKPTDSSDQPTEAQLAVYMELLVSGSLAEQKSLICPESLLGAWTALRSHLPAVVTSVWESRFPHLRR